MSDDQQPTSVEISADLLAQLAAYAGHTFPPERASQLAPMLESALVALRALRLDEYDDLQPAATLHLPAQIPPDVPQEA
jgi:hypothetical protein